MEIEPADQDMTVHKNPTMEVARKLTDPQRPKKSKSRRISTAGVKAANIRWIGKLQGNNFGK